jgi:hypothetical protein
VPSPADLLPLGDPAAMGAADSGSDQGHMFALSTFRELRWPPCANGTDVLAGGPQPKQLCLGRLQHGQLLDISSGDRAPPPHNGGKVPWRMWTVYPQLPEDSSAGRAWTLLGEVDKIVGMSPVRFAWVAVEVTDTESCVLFELSAVAAGEVVSVGAVSPDGTAAVASFLAAVLTEIYLCDVCSCQEILRRKGRPGLYLEQRFTAGGRQRICATVGAALPAFHAA